MTETVQAAPIETVADALKASVAAAREQGRPVEVTKARGHKTVAREPDPVEITFTGAELGAGIYALGNALCSRVGVQRITDAEAEEIGRAMAPVLTKYAGASLAHWGPEIALGVVLLKVGAPRAVEYAEIRKLRASESDAGDVVDFTASSSEHSP